MVNINTTHVGEVFQKGVAFASNNEGALKFGAGAVAGALALHTATNLYESARMRFFPTDTEKLTATLNHQIADLSHTIDQQLSDKEALQKEHQQELKELTTSLKAQAYEDKRSALSWNNWGWRATLLTTMVVEYKALQYADQISDYFSQK